MKEEQLRQHAKCSICHQRIGHTGLPFFWTVRIERHGLNADAICRQDGLSQMLGGHAALASIMGTNEDMTIPMMEPKTLTVCEDCSTDSHMCIAAMAEDD